MSYKEDSSISLPCQSIPVDVGTSSRAFPGFRAPSYTMVPDELFDASSQYDGGCLHHRVARYAAQDRAAVADWCAITEARLGSA